MRNPKKVFTKDGMLKYQMSLMNLKEAAFNILNDADDLLLDDDIVELLYKIEPMINKLMNTKKYEDD